MDKKINDILKKDGVIAFVTDTVWGVGCLPSSGKAVEKIYEIKGRDSSKPLILMSNDIKNLLPYIKSVPIKAQELIDKYFPGALTIVLEKSDLTPDFITSGFNTVGIRVPANKTFQEICASIEGGVLATTSANLSGEPSAKDFEEAKSFIGDSVDLVADDFGCSAGGLESTVVLVSEDNVKVLRQGAVKI